jgi:hypothetical protein
MRMKYKYAREKLNKAVRYLALGERDVRDRLRIVSKEIFRLDASHFPTKLQNDLAWVKKELTKYGPELGPRGEIYQNAVAHTLGRIRNSTGRKIAERIYNLCMKINAA